MGDFADDAIDAALEFDYHYRDIDDGEMDGFVRRRRPKRSSCDYCGQTDLMWRAFSSGWRLVYKSDIEKVHTCPEYREAKQKGHDHVFDIEPANNTGEYASPDPTGGFSTDPWDNIF